MHWSVHGTISFIPCVCFLFFSAGDNNQPSAEEVWWAAGVHLCWWHPHRSQSFSESQHLLSPGWLKTRHTNVPSVCPITKEMMNWLLISHATGPASVEYAVCYFCCCLFSNGWKMNITRQKNEISFYAIFSTKCFRDSNVCWSDLNISSTI